MVGLAALALLAAGAVTWLAALSITRPLRSLTRQARDMAQRRLPQAVRSVHEMPLGEDVSVPDLEPVEVRTHDEVAEVADVLNAVQTAALDLAVEQAVLRRNAADAYVNLARRYQDLLTRQLDAITELESGETRPGILADLYVLDHQSTRMRRNAESLLVLAGADAHRRSEHPAAMADVVRAALGEVADYERVAVKGVQYAVVDGAVVADLAHLLAELIDNALRFSPHDQEVEVRGHANGDEYQVGDHRPGPGHAARRDQQGQPPPGQRRVPHRRSVHLPRPVRDRRPVGPPRHHGRPPAGRCSRASWPPSTSPTTCWSPRARTTGTRRPRRPSSDPWRSGGRRPTRDLPPAPVGSPGDPAPAAPAWPAPLATPGLQVDRNGLGALRPSRATPWDMPTPPGVGPLRTREGAGVRGNGGPTGNGTRPSPGTDGPGPSTASGRPLDGVGRDPLDGIDDDDDGGAGPTAADPVDTPAH